MTSNDSPYTPPDPIDDPTDAAALEPFAGEPQARAVPEPPPRTVPVSAPRVSVRPARAAADGSNWIGRLVPPVVAGVVSFGALESIGATAAETGFLHRLFRPQGDIIERSVPAAILLLFVWTLVDLTLRHFVTRSHGRQLKLVSQLPSVTASGGIEAALERAESIPASIRERPMVARLVSLLDLLESTGDAQRSHDAFQHDMRIAGDTAVGTYANARLFIWAMPILGFIGTVMGIGFAVGEFSTFLTGEIDDVKAVQAGLSEIAGGLAYAFDSTLAGLVGSLLAMLVLSYVQNADERLHTALEELGLGIISNFRGGDAVGASTGTLAGLGGIGDDLGELSVEVGALAATSRELASRLKAMGDQEAALATAVQSGVTTARTVSDSIEDRSARFSEALGTLSNSMEALSQKVDVNEKLTDVVSRLATQVEISGQGQSAVATTIKNVRTGLDSSGNQFAQAVDTLNQRIEVIAESQETTKKLAGVIDSLVERIQGLEKVHTQSNAVVQQLSGPLEFRLVRSGDGPADGGADPT